MAVKTEAVGRSWDPAAFEVEAERVKKYADAIGAESPVHRDSEAARAAGFRDVVAPPMFCVVYSSVAMGPAILDPDVGMNFAAMVHGGQEFEWGAGLRRRHDHHHGDVQRHLRAQRDGLLRIRVGVDQPGRRAR